MKTFKKKIDEANLDKDKSIVRQRYLENQINKIQEDYNKIIDENNKQHENLYEKQVIFKNSSKTKFKLILEKKDEEINYMKSDVKIL